MDSQAARQQIESDLLLNAFVGREVMRVLAELGWQVRLPKPRGRPPLRGHNKSDEETLRMAGIGRAITRICSSTVTGDDSPCLLRPQS